MMPCFFQVPNKLLRATHRPRRMGICAAALVMLWTRVPVVTSWLAAAALLGAATHTQRSCQAESGAVGAATCLLAMHCWAALCMLPPAAAWLQVRR